MDFAWDPTVVRLGLGLFSVRFLGNIRAVSGVEYGKP